MKTNNRRDFLKKSVLFRVLPLTIPSFAGTFNGDVSMLLGLIEFDKLQVKSESVDVLGMIKPLLLDFFIPRVPIPLICR